MKLNDIDFDKLSDNELKGICLKYKIIDPIYITRININYSITIKKYCF